MDLLHEVFVVDELYEAVHELASCHLYVEGVAALLHGHIDHNQRQEDNLRVIALKPPLQGLSRLLRVVRLEPECTESPLHRVTTLVLLFDPTGRKVS